MQRMTVTLSEEDARLVAREARRRRMSRSAVVRALVQKELGPGPDDAPRTLKLIGAVKGVSPVPARDLDDYLRKNWQSDIDRRRR